MLNALKCRICGGDLDIDSNSVAVCLYCGSKQIVPKMTSERKQNLYDRADHYRRINEYDKAAALYEQVLSEDTTDAEVYWDIVLCKYGIEYVEDPGTKKRIPTINRMHFKSILEDSNYLSALQYASAEQKEVIESEARYIHDVQNGIMDISNKEKPYDISICYKETDENGNRTKDSVIAQDLYNELVKEDYKVFFSRITLEDILGSAFEPYIFAALHSAKVMIVIGTRPEYINSVWVKNEWIRYLSLINSGEEKVLIPAYKDMDPYDLPEEFSHLQAQDMGKLGFMQDLVRGIKKIISPTEMTPQENQTGLNIVAYKKRIRDFLDTRDFKSAKTYCDKILDNTPDDVEAHVLKLCAELEVRDKASLGNAKKSFEKNSSYQNAVKYAAPNEKEELEQLLESAKNRSRKIKKRYMIFSGTAVLAVAIIITSVVLYRQNTEKKRLEAELKHAEELVDSENYKEAQDIINQLGTSIQIDPQLTSYIEAELAFQQGEYETAKAEYEELKDYRDAPQKAIQCDYCVFANSLDNQDIDDYENAQKQLEVLLSAGADDTENISARLAAISEFKAKAQEFENSYNANKIFAKYGQRLLNQLKDIDEESANRFIQEHEAKWYKDALSEIDSAATKKGKGALDLLSKAEERLELCESDYKDVQEYIDIWGNRYNNIDSVLNKANSNKMASIIAWSQYNKWIVGSWKSSDGNKYFEIKRNKDKSLQSSYNLPWYDLPNSTFDIDGSGIYYLSAGSSRKDMYRISIKNKNQLEFYCYKDSKTYTLYRQ